VFGWARSGGAINVPGDARHREARHGPPPLGNQDAPLHQKLLH
jgi:hypothetical protein